MKIKLPNELFANIKKNISNMDKYAFLSSLIMGFVTHMYYITNHFPNADTNLNPDLYSDLSGWMICIGRWCAGLFDRMSSNFILPWVTGVISILLLSCVAVIIVRMFDIENRISIFIVSASIITFPSIMTNLGYIEWGDPFMFSYLFAVLAIYIADVADRFWKLCIASIILAISMGIYQSFICTSVVLCLLLLLKYLLDSDTKILDIVRQGGKYLFIGVFGSLVYFLMWKVTLFITKLEPADYKGLTDYNNYKISEVMRNILESYVFMFKYYFTNEIWHNPAYKIVAYFILLVIFAIFLLAILKNKKIYTDKKKSFAIIIVLLLLPIGYGFIKIIAPKAEVSPLTIENLSLFILMVFLLFEKIDFSNNYLNIMKWCTILCSALIIYSNILTCNIGYVNLQLQYEKSYACMQRIMNSIYSNGYSEKEIPIYISGNILGNNVDSTVPMQKEYLKGLELVEGDVSIYNTMYAKAAFINTYLGLNINYPDDNTQKNIELTEEFKKMPVYPKQGSIAEINNVLVVKMSD